MSASVDLLQCLTKCPAVMSWVELKLELRLTSSGISRVCHPETSLAMRVTAKTPTRILWVPHGPRISSRVRGVRPSKLNWCENPEDFEGETFTQLLMAVNWAETLHELEINNSKAVVDFESLNELLSKTLRLQRLAFYFSDFKGSISTVRWPSSLTHLDLSGFYDDIIGVEWPSNLKVLDLGDWSGALGGARFPDSLTTLTIEGFADKFPLEGVVKWDSVKRLSMVYFDEHMYGSKQFQWPVELEVLYLEKFNQPIDDVKWPRTLKHLYFGDWWDESIVGVEFPPSLEKLELGTNFRGTLVGAIWPCGLRELSLGSFDSSLDGVVFPDSLEDIWMGWDFNQPIDRVKWPSSLKKLTLPSNFRHPLDKIPAGVQLRE